MADGSISFAEGLGCKVQDSIEMRRKQMLISQNPKSSTHLGLEVPSSSTSVRSQTISNSQGNTSSSLQPAAEASESHTSNGKQIADLEQADRVPTLHQGDSSKSGPPIPQEQLAINSADPSSESELEGELLEVLEGVVSSSQGVSQNQFNLEVMDSRAGSIPSIVPRDGIVLKLNQTLSHKPPDPQLPEVRDEASKEDLKGNFQKVLSKSAQRRMKKIAKEQSLSSISRGRN
ncbi:hypothetical protein RHSIM_Rhsim09G0081200 [Rhododendron simsii]|uniref:Uncharacterized protein n=1 Tax=Rhododendron simsii TaxID=118357 RepID=A0A834LFI4_RHOSS|nr:hypothetical protein RHSIM_Rhsim09G0081200 [Rhododendron simsii]